MRSFRHKKADWCDESPESNWLESKLRNLSAKLLSSKPLLQKEPVREPKSVFLRCFYLSPLNDSSTSDLLVFEANARGHPRRRRRPPLVLVPSVRAAPRAALRGLGGSPAVIRYTHFYLVVYLKGCEGQKFDHLQSQDLLPRSML